MQLALALPGTIDDPVADGAEALLFLDAQHRTWLIPGVSRRFVPRWHGLATGGAAAILVGFLLAASGIWASRSLSRENRSFRSEGIDAECEVTSRRIVEPRGPQYLVACSYPADGRQLRKEFHVPSLRYRQLAPGTKIGIRYLRSDPSKVRERGRSPGAADLLLISLLFGGGTMMAGGAFLEEGLKRRRAEKRLEREGIVLPGRVVDCLVAEHTPQRGPVFYTMSVTYRFTCCCGAAVTSHENIFRSTRPRELPVDARVCVAFADPRCHRLL